MIKEALLQTKISNNKVVCFVCAHHCRISLNEVGKCGVRKNIDGKLYLITYNQHVSISVDPIEKKPLYHFLPDTMSYSIGCPGCNFKCQHCQNHMISQTLNIEMIERTVKEVVERSLFRGCASISYTFTEPTVSLEFVLDCMKEAKENGLKNVWVSNGFMTPSAFNLVAPYLDAVNISVKGDSNFYKNNCGAKLSPVLQTIRRLRQHKIHTEINCPVIPGYTDSENKNMLSIFEYLVYINPETILHLTKFQPHYKFQHVLVPTREQIDQMKEVAIKAGIKTIHVEE